MDDFIATFDGISSGLSSEIKDDIIKSFNQYSDASALIKGKSKSAVEKPGSCTKSLLVDAVFSLDNVCKDMFDVVLKLTKKNDATNMEQVMNKFEDAIQKKFDNILQRLPQASNDNMMPLSTSADDNVAVDDKEKHVIVLNEKDSDAKFDQTTWSTVVKGTLNDQLKSIPVDKSLLNKSGKGCLFFPNKQARNEAKAILEPLFDVTVDSRPRKNVMPKIKVFDIDTEVYCDNC